MKMMLNPDWVKEMRRKRKMGELIDQTITSNLPAKWLIAYLSKNNTPFKIHNLGAGVKRITTDTDTCPICKKKLVMDRRKEK